MYLDHFGLQRPPFRITPDPELFFPGARRGAILDALTYAITSGEGIVKVVGEVGSGKTMLCRMLEGRLPATVEIVYLAHPSLAPEDLPHAIAFELKLPVGPETERLRVMQALHDYLLQRHAANRQVVVFVEEAQGMPIDTLEEIRLLSNLETHSHKLLQMVLFGQPELDRNLAQTAIRQLRERITHSFNLGALSRADVAEYLHFRMHAAGSRSPMPFTAGAVRRIARASGGLIRRVNILADKALLAAYAEDAYRVEARHVAAAERDSRFGPPRRQPWGWAASGVFLGLALALGAAPLLQALVSGMPVAMAEVPPVAVVTAPASVDTGGATPTASVDGISLVEQRLAATRDWLSSPDPSRYTLQLMTADAGDARLERFLQEAQRVGALDEIYVYRTDKDSRVRWRVVYGSYHGMPAARRELAALPRELAQFRPFVRNLDSVLMEAEPNGREAM